MTQPRNRLFSTQVSFLNITASGFAGAKRSNLGASLEAGLGVGGLPGWTVGPMWLAMLLLTDGDNTSSSVVTAHVGVGVYPSGMDDGDFPDMALGDGDWMLRSDIIFEMPGVISTLVKPDQVATQRLETRSMRRIERLGDSLFIVVQQNVADDMIYNFSATMMWRAP